MDKSSGRRLAPAAAVAALVAAALLAGCGSSGQQHPAGPGTAGTGTAGPGTASASAATSAGAAFRFVTEPFDPGHPAEALSAPASCAGQDSTLAIEQCYEHKTETADAAIDAVQRAAFARASGTEQAAINAADQGWLAARAVVCAKAYHSGGTLDGVDIAACLLDESTARLDAVKGSTPPEAVLKSTDSTSMSDVSWYTTPEGSRIGMIDTQGDAAGGVIIAWIVIAGADGFVVNPAQFSYRDGSFTDAGTVASPSPAGHRVTPGAEYQFSLDYRHLSAAPGGQGGGWVYAPGVPAAVWR